MLASASFFVLTTQQEKIMSHFTEIDIQIKDIAALRAACIELGLTLLENEIARGYGKNSIRGDYVIKLSGPYDIAVNRSADHYTFVTDTWGGHVEKEVGNGFCKIKQLYGVHKATLEARKKGLTIRRQNLANGQVRLTIAQLGVAS